MPPKSAFSQGWSEEKATKLKQTPLPDKIRCSLCKRMKAVTIYSNKQILELRHHLYLGYDVEHSPIKCRKCVQTQNQELTCAICGEVKALDGFSKAQRRTPDTARCLDCVNDHLATQPAQRENWEAFGSDDEDEESVDGSEGISNAYDYGEYTNTASDADGVSSRMNRLTMQNLGHLTGPGNAGPSASEALSGVASEHGIKSNVPTRSTENNADADGAVWMGYDQVKGRSTNGKAGTDYTGYDSRGIAHRRLRAASPVMSDEHGFAPARPPRSSGFAKVKSDNRTFAKPSRGSSPPPPSVSSRVLAGRQVRYDDSETDEEFATL